MIKILFALSILCGLCQSAELKDKITVIVYTSEGCAPCIVMKKRLIDAEIKFTEIDKHSVTFIDVTPTTVICLEGKEISRWVGSKTKEEIAALIKEHCK